MSTLRTFVQEATVALLGRLVVLVFVAVAVVLELRLGLRLLVEMLERDVGEVDIDDTLEEETLEAAATGVEVVEEVLDKVEATFAVDELFC
jgi:hypothetical protein